MDTTYALTSNKNLDASGMDELTLIRLSQQGDQEMFAHLYQAYINPIYRYVYFRVADDNLAEDITSQIFLKVWEKLGTYQIGQSPFVAWIYRIARNTVIDHYRSKKVAISLDCARPSDLSHYDEVDEKLDFQIHSQELRAALQNLTKEQQQVLLLKFVDGLSTTEIAHQLKKQEGAIRALQMRALQGLAKSPILQRENSYVH